VAGTVAQIADQSMPEDFALTEDALDAERHLVAVRGDLDLHTAPELNEALTRAIDEGRSRLVVDLTETSYLDSSGLTALVMAHKRLRKFGGQLVVVNVDPSIGRTFEITGLHLLFPLVRERAEALQRLED
jgi:anti-sigma B factor antagonist